jgi:hypothetical protein
MLRCPLYTLRPLGIIAVVQELTSGLLALNWATRITIPALGQTLYEQIPADKLLLGDGGECAV